MWERILFNEIEIGLLAISCPSVLQLAQDRERWESHFCQMTSYLWMMGIDHVWDDIFSIPHGNKILMQHSKITFQSIVAIRQCQIWGTAADDPIDNLGEDSVPFKLGVFINLADKVSFRRHYANIEFCLSNLGLQAQHLLTYIWARN